MRVLGEILGGRAKPGEKSLLGSSQLVTAVTVIQVQPSSRLVVVDDERALQPRIVDSVVVECGAMVELRRSTQFGGGANGNAPR